MGLDQYAYVAAKEGERDLYFEFASYENGKFDSPYPPVRELAYWRKHPNLQGWMERLWQERDPKAANDNQAGFNCVELELTWSDIERLERDILSGAMAQLHTRGFFFGEPSDDHYREQDLKFVQAARAELFMGLRVFYNSSW